LRRCPEREHVHALNLAHVSTLTVNSQISTTSAEDLITAATEVLISEEIPLFDTFLAQIIIAIASYPKTWRGGVRDACSMIRDFRNRIASSEDPRSRQVGVWLGSSGVSREVIPGIDHARLLKHTCDQVNRIEQTALMLIKTFMAPEEQELLDEFFEDAECLFGI